MKLVVLQYGDYAEAYRRFREGGDETYRDQRHSVGLVAGLAGEYDVTTVAACGRPHRETLAPGLRSIGVSQDFFLRGPLGKLLWELSPERVILRTPNVRALRWLALSRVPVLPELADVFEVGSLRDRLRRLELGAHLAVTRWPCVTNHSLSASESVRNLGVPEHRIVPRENEPLQPIGDAKDAPAGEGPFRLFYAGAISEEKGVGDVIEAVARLRDLAPRPVHLSVAGRGDVDRLEARARDLGVGDRVDFVGTIPAAEVLQRMRSHDAVVVPSRHVYAEGLPNVLFEALASRSPLIASDHPSFRDRLADGRDSLRFRGSDPEDLARQVGRLLADPTLYRRLSEASADALAGLYVGTRWTELIQLYLDDPLDQTGWVAPRSLAAIKARRASRAV